MSTSSLESLGPEEVGKIASAGVQAFLQNLGGGSEIGICEYAECRVMMYKIPANLGRSIPVCPGCYGSPREGRGS